MFVNGSWELVSVGAGRSRRSARLTSAFTALDSTLLALLLFSSRSYAALPGDIEAGAGLLMQYSVLDMLAFRNNMPVEMVTSVWNTADSGKPLALQTLYVYFSGVYCMCTAVGIAVSSRHSR